MDTQMHKIDIYCALSIAVQRFHNRIFLINGSFKDKKL